ncbi:DUF2818 family protein [Paraburkholderia rhizosphaerae]|uniref:Uncharacterized protein DUF2818 n=1 Tax=Paraburkholderia rhizosphaerae TaxID=480658 RepID=A0A4V3HCN3_9BURK|nr:DUF2818 family protein [Paraburkholderia rhizosphaerae]TDY37854.1 uncharacterized protein DUF2818 [Paraburkholderia rhizosphaerae]
MFILALALSLANLPFVTNRAFGIVPLRQGKRFWVYITESALTYAVLAVIAYSLEARLGVVFVQNWQFYAITVSLLTVFSFPGFVWRFLL